MKIVIIEPLGITPEKLAEATAAVKARGHEIVAYDTKEEDQDKLAERGKDADIIIIAVKPWRVEEIIDQIKGVLNYDKQIIVSVAAGITFDLLNT